MSRRKCQAGCGMEALDGKATCGDIRCAVSVGMARFGPEIGATPGTVISLDILGHDAADLVIQEPPPDAPPHVQAWAKCSLRFETNVPPCQECGTDHRAVQAEVEEQLTQITQLLMSDFNAGTVELTLMDKDDRVMFHIYEETEDAADE